MPGTPVLHFSGRFRYDMPEYNNSPEFTKVDFDPTLPRDQVIKTCGCNPAHYFKFRFEEVRVTNITYCDGSVNCGDDPMLRQPVELDGFLVDVSPSAINARLFAGRMSVG